MEAKAKTVIFYAKLIPPEYRCSICNHPESDHEEEDDNSYCLGNFNSCEPPCRCKRFKRSK